MKVVALVQHQIIPMERVSASEGQHLSALQFMRMNPLHKHAGRDHQAVYVGYYHFEQPSRFIINKKTLKPLLESLLRYVPSLFGQTSPAMQYQFKVSVCGHAWIVTGCEHLGVLTSFIITDIAEGAFGNDDPPVFYLCGYGSQPYADMLEAIKKDYNVDSHHLKEATCNPASMPDGSNAYKLVPIYQATISCYSTCDICAGRVNVIIRSDNRKICITQRSAPSSSARPPEQPRPGTAPPGLQRVHHAPGQPFSVQDSRAPLLEPEHKRGCGCFKCGCCVVS